MISELYTRVRSRVIWKKKLIIIAYFRIETRFNFSSVQSIKSKRYYNTALGLFMFYVWPQDTLEVRYYYLR